MAASLCELCRRAVFVVSFDSILPAHRAPARAGGHADEGRVSPRSMTFGPGMRRSWHRRSGHRFRHHGDDTMLVHDFAGIDVPWGWCAPGWSQVRAARPLRAASPRRDPRARVLARTCTELRRRGGGQGSQLKVCPYSRETVAGCVFYRPRSEHGSGSDAADCRYSIAIEPAPYQRRVICGRRVEDVLAPGRGPDREADLDGRALAWRALHDEAAAERLGPRA